MKFSDFFTPGKKILIRTVTYFQLGEIRAVGDGFIILKDASWIADTGRFNACLKEGEIEEAEPFETDVYVSAGAIVDATEWPHDLPSEVI